MYAGNMEQAERDLSLTVQSIPSGLMSWECRLQWGHTVTDRILDKVFLSWEEVSGRIHQLLRQGEYAPQVVLDAARLNALEEHATVLAYMKHDMAEGVAEIVFGDTEIFHHGIPGYGKKPQ